MVNALLDVLVDLGPASLMSSAIYCDLTVFQPPQALRLTCPDTAVSRRKHCATGQERQALPDRPSRRCEVSEAVQTVYGCHPDVPFAILEKPKDGVARETIVRRECVGPAIADMEEAAIV